MAQAQISEARTGPAAAVGHIREVCADIPANQAVLLGDPATSAWLVRTALAAGDKELADLAARTAEALAARNPGFPAIAAAAHSLGLAGRDPARLARLPRSIMTRGPRPPPRKTSAPCTSGTAAGSRPSTT